MSTSLLHSHPSTDYLPVHPPQHHQRHDLLRHPLQPRLAARQVDGRQEREARRVWGPALLDPVHLLAHRQALPRVHRVRHRRADLQMVDHAPDERPHPGCVWPRRAVLQGRKAVLSDGELEVRW